MYFMCFYCIHSILPSAFLFLPTPHPPNLCLFLILQRKSVLPKYALMYGLLLQSDQPTRSYTLREDCLSLSQQLTIVSRTMNCYGLVCPAAFPCWDFSGLGFHRLVICCHNYCLQMSCCVQKMMFLHSHPKLCLSLFFSSSSVILEPWKQ